MNALIVALALSAQPGSADDVVSKAFADAPHQARAPESASSAGGRMLGWGLAIVAIATVAAMALKRRGQKAEAGFAEVAQNVSVGPKRSLLVVNFAGKRLLVGSTEAGFNVLSAEPLGPTEFDELVNAATAPETELVS